ncbi:MAG: tetratricopeptide repeat protein [Alphaproteobacteria bacterium]
MEALLRSGYEHYLAGRYDPALALFRKVILLAPDGRDGLQLYGLTCRKLGRNEEAEIYLRRTLRVSPGWTDASFNLGNMFCEMRRYREAVPLLRHVAEHKPDLLLAIRQLASAHLFSDQHDEATRVYRQVIALDPQDPFAHGGLGQALFGLGHFPESAEAMTEAARLAPGNLSILRTLGLARIAAGQLEEALAAFREALAAGHGIAREYMATALIYLGRDDEAEAVLRERLSDPDAINDYNGTALEQLGEILLRRGRASELRAHCEQLIQKKEILGMACALFGESLLAENRVEEGFRALRRLEWLHGHYFAVKSLLCFRQTQKTHGLPAPTRRTRVPGRKVVCMEFLSKRGRFAQTVLEYVLVRLYTEKYDMDLETPEWPGNWFFEIDDPLLSAVRPSVSNLRRYLNASLEKTPDVLLSDIDIGTPYTLYHFRHEFRDTVRGWLKPREMWKPFLDPLLAALRGRGRTVVAMHLRRGDFLEINYPITETRWGLEWLEAHWAELDDPVLYLASDELPKVMADFAKYRPVTRADLGPAWEGLEYLQDFYLLMNADILSVSRNSGFSFLAALLRRDGARTLAYDAGEDGLVFVDPWDGPVR